MTLQVLPPELLEPQDKIETKEPQPYWKPSSLKDGESEEFQVARMLRDWTCRYRLAVRK